MPPTTETLLVWGETTDGTDGTDVVIQEAVVSQLKLKQLAFLQLAKVDIRADLDQVKCLHLLLNGNDTYANNSTGPLLNHISDPTIYPGLGSNSVTTGKYMNFFMKRCQHWRDATRMKAITHDLDCRLKQSI